MTLSYRLLLWRKKRAIRRHDNKTYFAVVRKLAKIEVEKMIKEKMKP